MKILAAGVFALLLATLVPAVPNPMLEAGSSCGDPVEARSAERHDHTGASESRARAVHHHRLRVARRRLRVRCRRSVA